MKKEAMYYKSSLFGFEFTRVNVRPNFDFNKGIYF